MKWTSKIVGFVLGLFSAGASSPNAEEPFPPVPSWQPDFSITVEQVLERMVYYTDNEKDIAVFKHGTAVILPDGLTESEAEAFALEVLANVFNYHPDMNPVSMDDGNMLVQYNHPAFNVVITEFANQHISTIKEKHLDGLARDEVLITPKGPNKFDEFSMKALYGRTFMFMDAQSPSLSTIYRHRSSGE